MNALLHAAVERGVTLFDTAEVPAHLAVPGGRGRITAAGITKEVIFEPVDGKINDRIDEAYRVKYKSGPYLSPMIGARARSATVRVMAREIRG
jgi:hypothetical protein